MNQDFPMFFSAPGRTELSGNHTDHQRGCVLAGAVNLETTAEVRLNGSDEIRIYSEGYEPFSISIHDLERREEHDTAALVRGVAAAFVKRGAKLHGFDASIRSTVLPGSGLSSSAAFEVLMGTILNQLFLDGALDAVEIAKIGQYAENVYMGKPSGLLDQMASSVGGAVYMDFADPAKPHIEQISFDLEAFGYALCIIDSGADHADLTDEYAAIPREMRSIAALFGKTVLREVEESMLYEHLPRIRRVVGDRAVLRAMHFYEENRRAGLQAQALQQGDFEGFLKLVRESGESSWCLLQNIAPTGATVHQEVALALALAKKFLRGRGAVRVHGGGFAGTIQAFVPLDVLSQFRSQMEANLGTGCCHVLSIRPQGGIVVR